MKLAILLSGGKDSLYAAYKARAAGYELSCCLTMKSTNSESYMFHTPHIDGVHLQAEAMELPLLVQETNGEKEKELDDLKELLLQAKKEFGIEGVTTGAVGSQYQASRIQRICFELELYCFNPLWQLDQVQLLEELLIHQFRVIFTGVFAYPLTEKWLGRELDTNSIEELKTLETRYCLNPAGEGGELESYVLNCPLFKKQINIIQSSTQYENYAGVLHISEAELKEKEQEDLQALEMLPSTEAEVLIINCVDSRLKLHEQEMIWPLISAAKKTCRVVSLTEIPEHIPETHIIISGTGLRDDAFLEHKQYIQKILNLEKPILGICAGAELLLPDDHELVEILEIGPQRVETLHEHALTQELEGSEQYFLHHLGLRAIPFSSELEGLLATQKNIAAFKHKEKQLFGVQFHPEVSKKDLIKRFLEF